MPLWLMPPWLMPCLMPLWLLPVALALAPLAAVLLAFLFKTAFDRCFHHEHEAYNAHRLRRLARIHQLHLKHLAFHSPPPPARYHPPAVHHALLTLVSHITSDFILPWYASISPSSTFPDAIQLVLLHATQTATSRLSHINIPDLFAARILPKLTRHFDEYRKIEHLLNPAGTFTAHAIRHAPVNPAAILQSHHKHLHPALPASTLANPLPSVEAYLRVRIVEPLLRILLPIEDAKSPVVLALAREIVTCSILLPLVDMLTEPDFWNQLISDKMDPYLQERKQISQLRRAIESAAMASPHDLSSPTSFGPTIDALKTPTKPRSSTISVKTDAKSFDVFLLSISKIQSLTEAKRLRNDVDREMRALRNGGSGPEERRKEDAHLKRLEKARRRIDKRIDRLQGKSPTVGSKPVEPSNAPSEPTFRQILDDPSSLILFTEFMDRRGQSNIIQFWLAVNSFQTPLDDDDVTSPDTLRLMDTEIAYEDLSLLWARFLAPEQGPPSLGINSHAVATIGKMVTKHKNQVTAHDVVQAQQSAFRAQKETYQLMLEDSFPAFKKTDLYRKAAIDIQMHDDKLLAQRSRQSLDMEIPAAQTSLVPNQPPKWLSLSSHFPSFKSKPPGTEDAPEPPDDDQTTPKRPTTHRGRARRISNVFNMRSPSANDSRQVAPALGFLIGSPDPDDNDVRRGIFDDDERDVAGDESDLPNADDRVEIQRMEAIQAALTSIMERDEQSRNMNGQVDRHTTESLDARRSRSSVSIEGQDDRQPFFDPLGARQSVESEGFLSRPLLSRGSQSQMMSMGISPDYTRRRERVFDDEDNDDEDSLAGSVDLGSPTPSSRKVSSVFDAQDLSHRIDPGDTETGAEIEWMRNRLTHLREQETILDKMIRTADLKGSTGQHHLLVTSLNDLRLEIQALNLQKQQYEQLQQNSSIHPERTKIKIPSATVLAEEAGKQIVRYLIEVEQRAADGSVLIRWTVPRRFNEFYDLHQSLKADPRLADAFRKRNVEVPAKKLMPKLSEAFVEQRRLALEAYLLKLLQIPLACEHIALRRFLSQSTAYPTRKSHSRQKQSDASPIKAASDAKVPQSFYQSFTSSIDDILAKPSMLEVVSENLGKQAGNMVGKWDASVAQAGQLGLDWGSAMFSPVISPDVAGMGDTSYPFGAGLGAAEGKESTSNESMKATFIGPLCDFLMQLLDYKDNDWLRKPALLLILQHFMGSTIERKIRESCESALSAQAFEGYITMVQDSMWPNGVRRPPSVARTDDEKLHTRDSAASKIQALIPDIAANMIGRTNVRRAVRRSFGIMQVKILNLHLVLSIIDEFANAILVEPKNPIPR